MPWEVKREGSMMEGGPKERRVSITTHSSSNCSRNPHNPRRFDSCYSEWKFWKSHSNSSYLLLWFLMKHKLQSITGRIGSINSYLASIDLSYSFHFFSDPSVLHTACSTRMHCHIHLLLVLRDFFPQTDMKHPSIHIFSIFIQVAETFIHSCIFHFHTSSWNVHPFMYFPCK